MKYFLLLFLFFNSLNVLAQNKRFSEFLVTEAQDTLYGYVRETSEVVHIKQGVYFKRSKNAEEVLYPMEDILAYASQSGRIYNKKLIPRANKDSINRLVEVLFTGEVNLYQSQYDFYLEKDHKIYRLKNTETYFRDESGVLMKKYKKEYVKLLSVLLGDCYQLYDQSIKSDLDYQDLVVLLEKYHECTNEEYIVVSKNRKFNPNLNFGLFIGGFTASTSASVITNRISDVERLNDQNFFLGGDLIFKINYYHNFHFLLSPHFSFKNRYNYSTNNVFNDVLFVRDLVYEFNQLDLPLGIGFTLNNRKIQPVINIGIVGSQLWGVKSTLTVKSRPVDMSEEETITSELSRDIASNRILGFWTSFGINYHFSNNITFFNRIRYQATRFYTESTRIQNSDKIFNYHQFKFEIGVLF